MLVWIRVPDTQWVQTNQKREGFIAGPCKEMGGSCPESLGLPKGFPQSIVKGQAGEGGSQGMWSIHAQFSNVLLARLVPQQLILSVLGLQEAWG